MLVKAMRRLWPIRAPTAVLAAARAEAASREPGPEVTLVLRRTRRPDDGSERYIEPGAGQEAGDDADQEQDGDHRFYRARVVRLAPEAYEGRLEGANPSASVPRAARGEGSLAFSGARLGS